MKLKKVAKLQIARETLRNLNDASLEAAGGGNGSLTSGTVHGGACCFGCGCVGGTGSGAASCLCPTITD